METPIFFMMGPAGVGKSTLSSHLVSFIQSLKRTAKLVNLDPSCETEPEKFDFDVRDLVTTEEAMDSEGLGPNAGLLFAMSYFVNHHTNAFLDWLGESYESDFQYVFCDLPGQVEIFSHLGTMRKFKDILETRGYRVICLYLMDAPSILEPMKCVSSILMSLSCLLPLECTQLCVLTKCDLLSDEQAIDRFLDTPSCQALLDYAQYRSDQEEEREQGGFFSYSTLGMPRREDEEANSPFHRQREFPWMIAKIADEFSVSFKPHFINREESALELLTTLDTITQFDEAVILDSQYEQLDEANEDNYNQMLQQFG